MTHTPAPWVTEDSRTIQTPSGEFYLGYLKDKHGNPKWKTAYAHAEVMKILEWYEGLLMRITPQRKYTFEKQVHHD